MPAAAAAALPRQPAAAPTSQPVGPAATALEAALAGAAALGAAALATTSLAAAAALAAAARAAAAALAAHPIPLRVDLPWPTRGLPRPSGAAVAAAPRLRLRHLRRQPPPAIAAAALPAAQPGLQLLRVPSVPQRQCRRE